MSVRGIQRTYVDRKLKKREMRHTSHLLLLSYIRLEATSGLEPLVQLLQSRALPLGDVAL